MIVRVLEEEPENVPAAPTGERGPRRRLPLVLGTVATLAVGAVALAQDGSGSLTFEEVPSGWEDVPMTCDTMRIERGNRAIERFRCRALGGRPLPVGVFRPPGSTWTSDITRRPARDSRIEISEDGDVVGWAIY